MAQKALARPQPLPPARAVVNRDRGQHLPLHRIRNPISNAPLLRRRLRRKRARPEETAHLGIAQGYFSPTKACRNLQRDRGQRGNPSGQGHARVTFTGPPRPFSTTSKMQGMLHLKIFNAARTAHARRSAASKHGPRGSDTRGTAGSSAAPTCRVTFQYPGFSLIQFRQGTTEGRWLAVDKGCATRGGSRWVAIVARQASFLREGLGGISRVRRPTIEPLPAVVRRLEEAVKAGAKVATDNLSEKKHLNLITNV